MKTLIIISHPNIDKSSTQQFLMSALANYQENVTTHHLETAYPDGHIDLQKEQQLLKDHDRILLQFPLYWYSSPYLLKKWQDEVLDFSNLSLYQNKELGLVVNTGVSGQEFCAGGREQYSIDELLRPFQAVAKKLEMRFLKTFSIHQFDYLNEEEKQLLLIRYLLRVTNNNDNSLHSRTSWIIQQLKQLKLISFDTTGENQLAHLIDLLQEQDETISDLAFTLKELEE